MKVMLNLAQIKKCVSQTALTCCLVWGAAAAQAQQKFVRAQGTDGSKEVATQKAKLAAWKSYLGTLQGAKLDNILANEKAFLDDISNIVVDVNVIDEKCTSGFSSTCTVNIKAAINETMVDSRLRLVSKATSAGKASDDDFVAFLVMAREADSQISFDTKVTKRTESTVSTSGTSASADSAANNRISNLETSADAASVTQTSKIVTGGSQENKRDNTKYAAWREIDDLQNRVGEELTNNRINTVPWEALVGRCGVMDNDPFSQMYAESETGQLPFKVRNDNFKKIKDCDLNKFITAQITIDSYRTDPNTGLWLATGNVNITTWDLGGKFERTIGSANRNFSGRAQNKSDAARAALAVAAKMAADVVVNQLSRK
jgi:hypothetical protein